MRLVAERPTYSRTELISYSQVLPGRIKPEVWRKLSRWGLLVPRYWPTRRSRRGGVGKPRQINTGCKSPTPPHAFMQDLDSEKVDLVVTGCESKQQTQPAERHTCKNWECQQIQCVVTPYRVTAPQPGFVNHLNLTTVTVNKCSWTPTSMAIWLPSWTRSVSPCRTTMLTSRASRRPGAATKSLMLPSVSLTGPPSAETDRTGGSAVESSATSGMASLSTTGRSWTARIWRLCGSPFALSKCLATFPELWLG